MKDPFTDWFEAEREGGIDYEEEDDVDEVDEDLDFDDPESY